MLNRLHIENYKCLRDVTVELGDFTVLIGPNDSGKSSFLEVLHKLGKTTKETYTSVFSGSQALANVIWRKDASRNVVWEASGLVSGKPFTYHAEFPLESRPYLESLAFNGKKRFEREGKQLKLSEPGQHHARPGVSVLSQLNSKEVPFSEIRDAMASTEEYRFDLRKLCEPAFSDPDLTLHPSGDNLAGVLDALLSSPDRSTFEAVEETLHQAIPTLKGIALRPLRDQKGHKALEFILSGNGQPAVTIPARLASGGALLLTAYLLLAYGNTPNVLLLEEPENGLHPNRLKRVIDLLRKISTGEIGNRQRQVVLTTHSPILLNYTGPEEVRVFVRDPETGTQVTPMTKVPDIVKLLQEFAVGELWYLLGEEKLLEGKPA